MANWQSFEIQVPGEDLIEPVRNVLETLLVFLDVLKAILDTIKTFLIDFGNPIKALVEALIRLIEELFLSLKVSGIFAYFDVPDPTTDPGFDRNVGGFKAFTERFKASLYDSKDFNRPQPRVGSTQSGFVLLVVDASSPYALIARVKQLLRFFGKEFTSPRYEAPVNFKLLPTNSKGDPILRVASIFGGEAVNGLGLQWSLPSSTETPDPGYSDIVTKMAKEFVPPNYLIEKSVVNPAAQKIDLSAMGDSTACGTVEFNNSTYTNIDQSSEPVLRRQTLRDEYGEPVVKFQQYIFLDSTAIQLLLSQLGVIHYVDLDVVPGTTYYYRVRAFSGDLKKAGDQLVFPTTYKQLDFSIESDSRVMHWPSSIPNESVIMGKPSGVLSATVPISINPKTFDILGDLNHLIQTAFSLDFQLQVDSAATFGPDGGPTGSTSPIQVGRGSLTSLAAQMAAYEAFPIVGRLLGHTTIAEAFKPDPITGLSPRLPWQSTTLRRQSAKLAESIASAMLQAGEDALNGFRNLMQGGLPAGGIDTQYELTGADTLEKVVQAFTKLDEDGEVTVRGAQTFAFGYRDTSLRLNVLAGIEYVKVYSLGGSPVDWISVVPLRDIIPWSGQIIYDMLDKIQALLDAFSGVMAEIKAYIDQLERKIAALERFIEFLINILDFIAQLKIGAYVLSVPELTGSAQSWINAIDTAGGTKPPSGPGGYSAGVGLAYVGTDITAFKAAFSIIFG